MEISTTLTVLIIEMSVILSDYPAIVNVMPCVALLHE